MRRIGITTMVPIEVLLAAGYKVIDLNNLFITSVDYNRYIDLAERDGFPKSSCAWIKGIYGACLQHEIKEVVGVMEGDCSNTKALIEVLKLKGIRVYPFAYPHSHMLDDVKAAIANFMKIFGVDLSEVEKVRLQLNELRELAKQIDVMTYLENKGSGFENHLYQVSLSDFNGDIYSFQSEMEDKIKEIRQRASYNKKIRLAFIGVPPMTCDIYELVENYDAHFVYNEVQREFAFPRASNASNVYEQYHDYTYPYDIHFRLKELKQQIKERRIDGVIHYTQAFCYRAIEDIILKKELDIPILNIEGDKLNALDARTKLRIEAFIDMLSDRKE
ncbi:benzoyl-CoA reductase/2-hydroxyglutaryl-CoA dehydratase subunit BcrC/BadD/HgdB [Anaerosolibacter carboniphilus]|uniref:Benzoyl-CoA reductase/2-hydroxyglutaryl-CoA dehydratase subunit BcrC/BadD/HgdB n=1 Tax=Anaerosolibacter carboniphilus TaxID=1417629 RepID=A0A841KR30_9FIRM|nr:2-hydroxyacyl-CoA dehydratase [Anaerosolibacter carboniphilus]MBB6216204.1 benzoyl-CoA reductase/2-hydroxyglutaryl-CoA dehydratase subunit BcrC/BadD/HgdB [Anaerosolibacter carboniphilus]